MGNPLSDAVFNEFYLIALRKKMCNIHSTSCRPVDEWRAQPGRWCFGKTRMMTFVDAIPMTKHKVIAT